MYDYTKSNKRDEVLKAILELILETFRLLENGSSFGKEKRTMLSNDNTSLVPKSSFDGPILAIDVPALLIGVAEYEEGPTGCTVFFFPQGATAAIDIRGGSPGVSGGYETMHAICLAGGSLYGLEAAVGVTVELFAQGGYPPDKKSFPLVNGAIIYDYSLRNNAIYPDKTLGQVALRSAKPGSFPLGARGAGRSATVGKGFDFAECETAGQGGAFRQVGPTKIAVFTVVNASGVIVNRQGQVVRGNFDRKTEKRHHLIDDLERRLARLENLEPLYGNTTLTVIVTNQKLDPQNLSQVGKQVHCSMARAIQPFHTVNDGDVLYAVTTNEVEHTTLNATAIGLLASELAWDAVLNSFQET